MAFVLSCAMVQAQETLADWLGLLRSRDPEVRACARARLLERSSEAEALLEQRLRGAGALEDAELLVEIRRAAAGRPVTDEEIKAVSRPDGSFVRAKMEEARALATQEHHHEALRIVEALLVLEPAGPASADLRLLRQGLHQRVLQAEYVRLEAVAELPRAAVGTAVRVDFRITNISHSDLKMAFGAGPGILVADVRVTLREPLGGRRVATRPLTAVLPQELELAPGKSHTVSVAVATDEDLPEVDAFRLHEVHGWLQPMTLTAGSFSTSARLVFPTATVRVVPRADAAFLADPLFSLRQSIDRGTLNDVFLCGLLLEGAPREEAVGILIDLLPSLDPTGRVLTTHLLELMTGKILGPEVKPWQDWRTSKR